MNPTHFAAAPLPLACIPGAIPAGERRAHADRARRLFARAARERLPLADGYAYRFHAGALDELARWITNERRCCPFLAFTLEVTPADVAVWLRLTGPDGTHAFLDAELPSRAELPAA